MKLGMCPTVNIIDRQYDRLSRMPTKTNQKLNPPASVDLTLTFTVSSRFLSLRVFSSHFLRLAVKFQFAGRVVKGDDNFIREKQLCFKFIYTSFTKIYLN